MVNSTLFSKEELSRYNRHIIIPGFGMEAQQKLKKARVLVVGAGGLGSPVLLYLAAAGVGQIGIVDCDTIDDSNLQRQVLYDVESIGKLKAEKAMERLKALNPYITITIYNTQLTSKNALEIIREYDVVADGTDNFPTRYLVNDACVLLNKTNVYASIYQFEGYVSVFNYLQADGQYGPNYRDLYPDPPPAGSVANCSEAGVLGVLPGIIGSMQALEVIKVASGVGEVLSGRLFIFDALSFETRTFNVKKSLANPLNGEHPTITALIDYEQFCGVKAMERKVKSISSEEFSRLREIDPNMRLIDVREADEYELVNIGGELMPLSTISEITFPTNNAEKIVVMCKSGMRSTKAIQMLEDKYGCQNMYNLEGGIIGHIHKMQLGLPTY